MNDGPVELGCCAVCAQAQDICPEATFDWWEAGLAGFVCHACSQLTEVTGILPAGSHRGDKPALGAAGPRPRGGRKARHGPPHGAFGCEHGGVTGKDVSHLSPVPLGARDQARPTYGRGIWRPRSGGR